MHTQMQKTAQDMSKGFESVTASIQQMYQTLNSGGNARSGAKNPLDAYVTQAKKAASELRTAYANINKAIGAGDKGQEDYWRTRASEISQAVDTIVANARKMMDSGSFDANALKGFNTAIEDIAQSVRLLNSVQINKDTTSANLENQRSALNKIRETYDNLTRSIREYNALMKAGDYEGASKVKANIAGIISQYKELEQSINSGV